MRADQRNLPLYLSAAGFLGIMLGFSAAVFQGFLLGSVILLAAALVALGGSVMMFMRARDTGRRLPRTVEEQRRIIHSMAEDIRSGRREQ